MKLTFRVDNPYITPFRYLGKSDCVKDGVVLYRYVPNAYKMAKDIADELGLIEIENFKNKGEFEKLYWSVPSHLKEDLRFIKINGEYLNYERLPKFTRIDGSWDECFNKYKEHYNAIREMFLLGIAKFDKKLNSKINLCEFIDNLQELRRIVMNMSAKIYKSSKYSPEDILNLVKKMEKEIINKCENVLKEN